ncbi:phosphatase PAP2 family protein [Neptunicella marina]|uniref:undecaprenyl-diphosphate phosphatase n=1 Tax=Neptunicella marina TaxID=2125989 RepID=A0A8J6LY06_9ALTE|nr:phosphatase PAP2 family protein [Neptunicella marina]MBC3765954.1 phosphatase PAP2 family protein [Neptunicella marina]
MNLLSRTDTQLFYWLFNKTEGRNCTLIRMISKTGDGYLYLLVALLIYSFEQEKGSIWLYSALLAYAMELPLYVVLKKSFKRQRPCDLFSNFQAHISPSDKFSLPSGHTAAAFLMASLLAHFYPGLTPLVYCWASVIGISRVLLGVHYPSDIVVGALLGETISLVSLSILL